MIVNLQELIAAFSLGIVSTLNPCVLPLFPGFLVYLSQMRGDADHKILRFLPGILILAGVLSSMLFLGLAIAIVSVSIGSALVWVIPIADGLLIIFGLLMIFDINPFMRFSINRKVESRNPLLSSFLYGLLYGPLTFPCSGPLIVGIFAYSFTVNEMLDKLLVFIAYGLGMGIPLIVLSILSGAFQSRIVRFIGEYSRVVKTTGGLLLIGIGVFHLFYNREMFQIFLR
jgi:cytochrome c-type biogenesis protein